MIFYRISELMLATLIQRYAKNRFIFWPSSETRDKLKFCRLSDATFYDRITSIYKFIKPFLDKNCLLFRNIKPLTLSVPNFRRLVVCFSFLTNYRLKRSLYIKLKDWMSNSVDPDETSHMSRFIWISAVCESLLLSPVAVKELMRYPANTQRDYNVVTTSLQRHDVAATLMRRRVFAGKVIKVVMPMFK